MVVVCAALVALTSVVLNEALADRTLALATECIAVLLAAVSLLLPWERLPPPALLLYPVLVVGPLAVAEQGSAAYNGLFTIAATYTGVTQRRSIALAGVPALVPFAVLANDGVTRELLARLPVSLAV